MAGGSLDLSAVLEMDNETKVLFLDKVAAMAHISTEKLLAVYSVLGDDTFMLFVMFADDEVKFPALRDVKRLISVLKKDQGEATYG